MNVDDQNFEALQRLLKLKRYEKPPPRYFNDFSSQVLNRIRNTGAGAYEDDHGPAVVNTWLSRILGAFQSQPALAGAFGAAVCALLVFGVAFSERLDANPSGADLGVPQSHIATIPNSAPIFGQNAAFLVSSTNPITPASGSLFDLNVTPVPQQVNYSKPGGN